MNGIHCVEIGRSELDDWTIQRHSFQISTFEFLISNGRFLSAQHFTIENLKHDKMLDPFGQLWQSGSAMAA